MLVNPTRLSSDVVGRVSGTAARADQSSAEGQIIEEGWFDPADEMHVIRSRAVAERRRAYEDQLNTLWRDVKTALGEQMASYGGGREDAIEWGQTPTGGFAATRFRRPLALLDVALDLDSGLIACVYAFGTLPDAPYQESLRVQLVTKHETLFLRTQEGRRLETCGDAAQDLLKPFIARLDSQRDTVHSSVDLVSEQESAYR